MHRVFRLLGSVLLLLLVGLPSVPAAAAPPRARPDSPAPAPSVRVMLEFAAPPLAHVYAASARERARQTTSSRDALRTIERQQQAALPQIQRLGVRPIARLQRAYNGIIVSTPPAQLLALRQISGVIAIHPVTPKYRDNARSSRVLEALGVWASGGLNLTGKGLRIGIIDGGIDYTHVNFGGSGLYEDYFENDLRSISDPGTANNFGSGKKVADGYDFVGETYDSSDPNNAIPQPDPDPLDCDGHGSHVAGSAAGSGVITTTNNLGEVIGTTFLGPYDNPPIDRMLVAPGIAPEATLYALRVFGCVGSSDVVELGIEWALDPNNDGDLSDHLDVINMSLGSPNGGPNDPTAIASDNAALAGVIVVASAGNAGDGNYLVGTPGSATRALSVAASVTNQPTSIASFSSRGPRIFDSFPKPDIAAPGSAILSAAVGSGDANMSLSGTSMAAPFIAGGMALLRQQHPSFSVEELKALAMNTTSYTLSQNVQNSPVPVSPVRGGSGQMNLRNATHSTLLAYSPDHAGGVSLGFGNTSLISGSREITRSLRIRNFGATAHTLDLVVRDAVRSAGTSLSISPSTITLAANSSQDVTVTLRLDAAELGRGTPDPTLPIDVGGQIRQWVGETSGWVEVIPRTEHPTLRVPFYAAPRLAAQLSAVPDFTVNQTLSETLQFELQGTAIARSDLQSRLSVLALQQISPQKVFNYTASADLAAIGVISTLDPSQASDPLIFASHKLAFGIATYGHWSAPRSDEVRFSIYIDTNSSGISKDTFVGAEYLVQTGALGSFSGGFLSDSYVATLYDVRDLNVGPRRLSRELINSTDATTDTGILNGQVLIAPVGLSALGLSPAQSVIRYRVVSEHAASGVIDISEELRFDPANPGISLGPDAAPLRAGSAGERVALRFDQQAAVLNKLTGLLVLHHHNPIGQQYQILPFTSQWQVWLPQIATPLQPSQP